MKTVQDIYDAYHIMPSLQLHQLRVAAVGKMVSEDLTRDVDTRSIVLACLFHDMGNIIKSDLVTFPDFLEPEGKAHWQLVKDDFIARYGSDEHEVALAIAQEIRLSPEVRALINGVGFSKLEQTRDMGSYEQKVVEYADLRVGPHGVLSMEARLSEARTRYADRRSEFPRDEESFEVHMRAAREIEKQLFSEATITPEDVTEHSIQPLISELREYEVI